MYSNIQNINPNAQVVRTGAAIQMNISVAHALAGFVSSNLGPNGSLKMLVSGGGDLKLTKDGKILLSEVQLQHPTASLIARTASAQDDITGDGTTSNVILIGELLKLSERHINEGLHPRILAQSFEIAKKEAIRFLDEYKVKIEIDRNVLISVARTSLRTKIDKRLADILTPTVVDAVLSIKGDCDGNEDDIDLHMVEIMSIQQRSQLDSKLIRGIVLDHGLRHPDMPKMVDGPYILILNVSLEYEKTEINSGIFYKTAEERENMVKSEREFIDARVRKIIELKRKVCVPIGSQQPPGFVVINQKGIDPTSLDMFAKEGIFALRRAKRRNMERLALACGGQSMNSVNDLKPEVLGSASVVYEETAGENKFTFVEVLPSKREHVKSVTILLKGGSSQAITQAKEALRDGLRAVKNAIDDKYLVPGAGSLQFALHNHLHSFKQNLSGKSQIGVSVFADSLLAIPKALAANSGLDIQESMLSVQSAYSINLNDKSSRKNKYVGLNLSTGMHMNPMDDGIYDNYFVHKQLLNNCSTIASQILLVDEIIKSGKGEKNEQLQ